MAEAADTLGELIDRERKVRRWSQERVGDHFGVGQPVVSRWIHGEARPSDDLLPRVATWLRLPLEEVQSLKYGFDRATTFGQLAAQIEGAQSDIDSLRKKVDDLAGTVNMVVDAVEEIRPRVPEPGRDHRG